ncbi:GNAT family N-acetyltransferase [Bacillus sp. BGMRC 2118]|nr:GNAT family N-acetyltransferase [Bacillus sp. BGMRC 2118]
MTIKWEEITLHNQEYLNQLFDLYDNTFPIEVREPHKIFLNGLQYAVDRKPNNFHNLIGLDGNRVVSFATGHYLADVNAGFIVYIATDPNVRSKGLGSHTLLKIEELLNNDAVNAGYKAIKTVVLETESIEWVQTYEEKQDCLKRYKFFDRNNYQRADSLLYLQPPLHPEESEVPLYLYGKNLIHTNISQAELQNIVRAIYNEKYLRVNEIDQIVLTNCLRKMKIES